MTGGSVTLAEDLHAAVTDHGPADLLLATSMVDLSGLLGLARRDLEGVPAALYMHENQITQPNLGRAKVRREHALISWTSLAAADAIAWNSRFHMDSVLGALPRFLGWYPDRRHGHLISGVAERSAVLPVGMDLRGLDRQGHRGGGPPLILWNHRWDDDKDPGAALAALIELAAEGLDFVVALTGERFVGQRDRWADEVAALGDRVVADADLPTEEYRDIVRKADIVLSTAHHEFFGISVAEAMNAGVFPIVPNGLVYPERIPTDLHDLCLYDGPEDLRERLRWALTHSEALVSAGPALREAVAGFDWSVVAGRYDEWIDGVVHGD